MPTDLRSQFWYNHSGITPGVVITLSGMQSGDAMIAVIVGQASAPGFAVSGTGWTQIMARTTMGTRSMQVWAKAWAGESTVTIGPTANGAHKAAILTVRNAAPVANWVIGAVGTRGATSSKLTTLPALTGLSADTTVLSIFGEATNTTEGTAPTVDSGVVWVYGPQIDATYIETIVVGYQAAVGSSPAVTANYPNAVANNGAGIQIGIGTLAAAYPVTVRDSSEGPERIIARQTKTIAHPGAEGTERGVVTRSNLYAHPGADGTDRLVTAKVDGSKTIRVNDAASGTDRIHATLTRQWVHTGAEGTDFGYRSSVRDAALFDIGDATDRLNVNHVVSNQLGYLQRDLSEGEDWLQVAIRQETTGLSVWSGTVEQSVRSLSVWDGSVEVPVNSHSVHQGAL